jgi:LPXTG-motif cell wall-anchored protein
MRETAFALIVVLSRDRERILIKRIALMTLIFILSLSTSVSAAESGIGIIEGQIVNGTEGGSSVTDQEITLSAYINDTEVDPITTKTGSEGHFVFDSLPTELGYSYQVKLVFQEVEYLGEWLNFSEGETSKFIELTVYDSTTSGEAITIEMAHTIIYIEEGSLLIQEYFLFDNAADLTYTGSELISNNGTKETLRFPLPKNATELQLAHGLMECCIYSDEEGFVHTMPVLPGSEEVLYSYRVDYNSGEYTYSRNVNYLTANYDLLSQGQDSKVTSEQLTTGEPLDIGGTWFNHLSGTDFIQGDTLVAHFSGLPKTSNQNTFIWVILAMVALVGGFSFYLLMKRKRVQPINSVKTVEQEKQELLVGLAQLDDDFEDGSIPEEVYQRLRAEKKAHLVELVQQLKVKKDDG